MPGPIVFNLRRDATFVDAIASATGGERGPILLRRFPDGESYVRVQAPVEGRHAIVVVDLHHPDDKLVGLYLASQTLRDLGARSVALVAPYLPYMRQDERFCDGEGVSARYIAGWLAGCVDWLVTLDPHLHRTGGLGELYPCPTRVAQSAADVAHWIVASVERPVLIGPDVESGQWVEAMAEAADLPFQILKKERHGDREVEISAPDVAALEGHTPVIVDDIISTGRTMAAALQQLRSHCTPQRPPVCVGIHAVFADPKIEATLRAEGACQVATTDTIAHSTNAVSVAATLGRAVAAMTDEHY